MNGPRLAQQLFDWVLWNSAGGAVLVVLVLLAQRLIGSRVSARWRYNLWLLVVARLVVPALPALTVPAFQWPKLERARSAWTFAPAHPGRLTGRANLLARRSSSSREGLLRPSAKSRAALPATGAVEPKAFSVIAPEIMAPQREQIATTGVAEADRPDDPDFAAVAEIPAPPVDPEDRLRLAWNRAAFPASRDPLVLPVRPAPAPIPAASVPELAKPIIRPGTLAGSAPQSIPWGAMVLLTWLGTAAALLGRIAFVSARLALATRRLPNVTDPAVRELLEDCCRLLKVRRPPVLLIGPADSGPALLGVLHPKLLLPPCVLTGFAWRELRLILLHELAHLKRRDIPMNYVLSALQALHWFNPLVWLAFRGMRADRELACDEMVLSLTPWRESRAYGSTIVKLLELLCRGTVPAGAMGAIQHKALMHRRIAMIAQFDSRKHSWSATGLMFSLVIATAAAVSSVRAQSSSDPQPPRAGQRATAQTSRPPVSNDRSVSQARAAVEAAAAGPHAEPAATPAGSPELVEPEPPQPSAQPGSVPLLELAPAATGAGAQPPPAQEPMNPAVKVGEGPGGDALIRSVQDPASVRADEQTLEKLRHPHPLEVEGIPLSDVLAKLADIAHVDIVIDNRPISEADIDPGAAAVTLKVRETRPVEDLLKLSLRLVDPALDFSIVDGVVFVSTRAELSRHLVTRVYRIEDLGNAAELAEAIAQTVPWLPGRPGLHFFGSNLIVTTSEPNQRQIAKLLQLLRDQTPARAGVPGHDALTSALPNWTQERLSEYRKVAHAHELMATRYAPSSPQVRETEADIAVLEKELGSVVNHLQASGHAQEAENLQKELQSIRQVMSGTQRTVSVP